MYKIKDSRFEGVKPMLKYGESVTLGFEIEEPTQEGDSYILAIDDDMKFVNDRKVSDLALVNQLFVFSDKAVFSGNSVSFDLEMKSMKYREKVNGKKGVDVYVEMIRKRDGILTVIMFDVIKAYGAVYNPNDSAKPIVPPPWLVDWSQIHGIPEEFPPAPHTQGMETVIGLNDKIAEMDRRIDDAVIPTWSEIQDKPDTFPPSEHTQGIDTIDGLTERLNGLDAKKPTWDDVQNKPTEFKPEAHTQGMETVIGLNDKIAEMDRRIDDAVIPTWTEIQGKPDTFTPSEHTQGLDTITGLKEALDGKQNAITDANKLPASKVSGLSKVATSNSYSDLDGKPAIPEAQVQTDWNLSEGIGSIRNKPTEFPPAPHSQGIDTIDGLNDRLTELDAKKPAWTDIKDKPESYPPSEHTQSIASVNGLQDALDGKLTTPQGGAVGDVVGFGPSWVRLYEIEGTELTGTEVTMDEKHCYRWNAVGDCTISRGKWKMTAETWSTAQIDVAVGATVTGVGITMVGTLEAGKRNYCQMRGFDGEVRFYVLESYEVAK